MLAQIVELAFSDKCTDKAMIPEEYITRVPHKSPCLFRGDGGDDDDGSGSVRLTTRGVGASRASPNDEQFLAVALFIVNATINNDDRLDQLLALKRAQPKAADQIAEAARNTSEALSNKLNKYPDGAPTLCNLSKLVAQIDKAQDISNEEKADLLYAVGHGNKSAQNVLFEQIRKDREAQILKCNGLLNAVKSRFPAAAVAIEHHGQDNATPAIGLLPDAHAEQDDDADTYDWDNDPAFREFSRKLDIQEHLHYHRLHPVSRFTDDEGKDCRHCQAKILPEGVSKAAKVCPGDKGRAQKNWNELNERHQKALNDLSDEDMWRQLDPPQRSHEEQELIKADKQVPWRGTHCPVCRVAFTAVQEHTVTAHWAIHRLNYVSWLRQQQVEAETNNGEPLPNYLSDMKVDSLLQYEMNRKSTESDIASLSDSQLNTRLRYIEKLCNLAENEVLEREEFCRLCYQTFHYGDLQLAKHYKRHRKEHVKQNIITDNALNADLISSTSTSPVVSPTSPRQRAGRAAVKRLQVQLEAERRKILNIKNNDPFIFAVNVGVLPDIAAQQTKLSSQEGSPKVSAQQRDKAGSKRSSAEHEDFQFQVSPRTAKLRRSRNSRHVNVHTLPGTDTDEDLFVAPYFFDETAVYDEQADDVEPEYILDDIADSGDELDIPTSSVDENAHNAGAGPDPEGESVLDSATETDFSAEERVDEEVIQETDGSDSESHEDMEIGENAKQEVDSEIDTEAEEEVEGEEKAEDDSDSGSENEDEDERDSNPEEAEDDIDSRTDPESSSDSGVEIQIITQCPSKSGSKKRRVSFKEDFYGELPSPLSCSESLTPPTKPKRRKTQDATFRPTEEEGPSPPITPKCRSRKATPAKKTHKTATPVKRSAVTKTNKTSVKVPAGYKKGDSPISNRTRHKRPRKEMWKL